MTGGVKVQADDLLRYARSPDSKPGWLALALYKEGHNSTSEFYKFLSFWKVLEVAIRDRNKRWEWINSNAENAGIEPERLSEMLRSHSSIAEYLYGSGRCAIAHVSRDPVVNPDDLEDRVRLSRDARIVEHLARMAITQGLTDQSSG